MMNLSGLAYVVAETTDLARWKAYAESVLGMMTASTPDGSLQVRMDERQFRFAVQPGQRDGYVASGWEVLDQAGFEHAVRVLREASVEHRLEDAAFCERRCVQQAVSFRDPSGNRHEVVWGFKSDFVRFARRWAFRASSLAPSAWAMWCCRRRNSRRPPPSRSR
jgi:3,4-dihydroxy-9,10-secoandrosta-1,3,5(10)-triene-9,17-dione 4,5-dioxygenase